MGDRSPKSRERDQKHKDFARAEDTAAAKSKQEKQSHIMPTMAKGKK